MQSIRNAMFRLELWVVAKWFDVCSCVIANIIWTIPETDDPLLIAGATPKSMSFRIPFVGHLHLMDYNRMLFV